jgi:hypothetical protein
MTSLSELLDSQDVPRETPRDYIGASSIGSACMRQIWYAYNGYEGEPISPRLARTFQIGKVLEQMVIFHLENAGVYIAKLWYDLVDDELDYFKGHIDAMWTDEGGEAKAVLEVKTAKDSSFKLFAKNGLRRWSLQYYAQVQAYMGMSEIHESYVICLNKDTSELHDEYIAFQPQYYEGLKFKAQMIHDAQVPPVRVNNSPAFYLCKMCKFHKTCHNQGELA